MSIGSAVRRFGRLAIDLEEWLFDVRHSVETRRSVVGPRVDATHAESASHGTRYEATRLYVLRRLMAECHRSGDKPRTFVDVGCGKGRVCFFAAGSRQYDRVIGVELSETLVATARLNLERFRAPCAIEFLCEDATRYRIPAEQSLVFLNNPFDAQLLRAFLDHNCEQLVQARTLIGYHHDFHRHTILDARRFEVLFRDQKMSLSLYRASR